MNKKGLYTGIVAVIGLVILAGFSFSSQAAMQGGEVQDCSESISDFKRQAGIVELMLFKTASDGLADGVFVGGCTFNQLTAEQLIENYMTTNLGFLPSSYPTCNVANLSAVGAGGSVTIDFDLSCQKSAGGSSMSYTRHYTLTKNYSLPGPVPPDSCCVQVTDPDLGLEVNQCA